MSYKSQTGSHRSAARQLSKASHEKKSKEKKQRAAAKYLQEETPQATPQEVAAKTLNCLQKMGSQIFALSPFSQYFDDWVINLRQVIGEFESNPAINADEQFTKERSQIFLDIEGGLAEKKLQESNLSDEAKALADNNHLIVHADKEYAEKTRELSNKRNSDVQRLTNKINELEEEVARQNEIKVSFYKFNEKKRVAEKLAQTKQDFQKAKNELEVTLQNFTAEQEKLHDNYEKKKQELNEKSDRLHRELEKLETDTSTAPRQTGCNSLITAINELIKRMPPASQEP
jgi:hypothetical protein